MRLLLLGLLCAVLVLVTTAVGYTVGLMVGEPVRLAKGGMTLGVIVSAYIMISEGL